MDLDNLELQDVLLTFMHAHAPVHPEFTLKQIIAIAEFATLQRRLARYQGRSEILEAWATTGGSLDVQKTLLAVDPE